MKVFIILLVALSAVSVFSETKVKKILDADIQKIDDKADEALEEAIEATKRWSAYGSFSYLDTWLPGKIGLSGVYGDDSRTYELAYQSASYSFDFLIDDLGKITDQRIHLTTRSHTWDGSFNFQYGIYYNSILVELGNAYTAALGNKYDVLRVDTVGVVWGMGNRWNWDNGLSLGLDWFKIFIPLKVVNKDTKFLDENTDPDNQDDVDELVEGLSHIPAFTLAHFEIGYRF